MKFNDYLSKVSATTAVSQLFLMIMVASLIVNVLLASKVAFTTERVSDYFYPPGINKTFWVEDNNVSKEYLDQSAIFFTQLMYNGTPATIEGQQAELRKYVAPELYSALDKELRVTAVNMKNSNISTYFTSMYVGSDEATKSATIDGEFVAIQGNTVVQRSQRKIEIKFKFSGGKLVIERFADVSAVDPATKAVPNQPSNSEVNSQNAAGSANNQSMESK